MALYENSHPQDASLITPELGDRKRYTTIPDLYTSKTQLYNATLDYQFDGAHLTSSSSYRSEEHTSELQSLMRISYAVFCLTKKITPFEHHSPSITSYITPIEPVRL